MFRDGKPNRAYKLQLGLLAIDINLEILADI